NLVETILARDARGEDCSPSWSRFYKTDRKTNRGFGTCDATTGSHQQHGTAKAGMLQLALEVSKIAADQRLKICVGASGGEPLIFALFGGVLGRQRPRNVRKRGGARVPASLLVIRFGEAVKEPDRYRLYFLGRQCLDRALDAVFVEIL